MSLWQPRSVLQLVLLGFFVALAPLLVAILYTVQTLDELTVSNQEVTRELVEVTRLGQNIQRDVLEIERRARQYLALEDPEFVDLFQRERDTLLGQLRVLRDLVHTSGPDVEGLLSTLEALDITAAQTDAEEMNLSPDHRLDQQFSMILSHRQAAQKWLLSYVDSQMARSTARAATVERYLITLVSTLTLATLALLLFFAYWINKPVKDLTQEIHLLATSGLSHPIEISGPHEVKEMGSKLEWLRSQLHESEQQKQQFLRHISHELKTPLASLREGADLLADQVPGKLSSQQLVIVDIVQQNGIELQRLIENLLDYNQLPNQELKLSEVDLAALCNELFNSYRLTVQKKGLKVSFQNELDTWVADRHKLKTALDNLLSNAVNYTPDEGIIDVAWRQEGDKLLIDVANSGQAIPEEEAEHLFEPFYQGKVTRSGPIKGSGIGLSVARDCIEAHGGSLELADHALPVCFRLLCPSQ